ncbi:MAG: DNA polymerase Y family protein [Alphaproteobacteria bacterium]
MGSAATHPPAKPAARADGGAGAASHPAAPLVLVADRGNRRLVHAADARALAEGVVPGMSLSDARAVEPGLAVRQADPVLEARARRRLVRWCSRFTPLVADGGAEPGGAAGIWLDVTGCGHLFGGDRVLLRRLLAALADLGFTARAALAATPGAAWALARYGDPAGQPFCLGAQDDPGAALAPLPVAALRLAPEQAADLARLGLRRIGELAAVPRAALAHRFEGLLLRRLDQALGRLDEPVSPALPAPAHSVRLALAEPIGHAEAIAGGLEHLLAGLARKLERAGLGARQLLFQAYGVDGHVSAVRVGAGRPTRDPAHWMRLFRDRLERIDPGFGLDALRLSALAVEPFVVRQAGLGGSLGPALLAGARAGFDPAVEALVDRLANRLGGERVFRWVPRESHWPERAAARRPAAAIPARPSAWPAMAALRASRPLRLLRRPEPVAALAPSPADPPVRLSWRRQSLAVVRAEGPERIVPEWWRAPLEPGEDAVRDYYRVELADGRRLWLARAPSPTAPETRWYVHGVFD